ncbi:MAG: AAA family ATPase [Clostridiales bacterium]|nr:AAA family ATPase [Clostridiales bacterium]
MQLECIQMSTIEQQQAVFGTFDHFARIIEKAFAVSIILRESVVEVRGEQADDVSKAASVIRSLQKINEQGESDTVNEDTVYRLIDHASDGEIDETMKAMENMVTMTHRGLAIKCKTLGQKNYSQAMQKNAVTVCIGPAGTGKTYLAVAQAAEELKRGEIERIIMSRPAIEAGEERLGFLPGDLSQKVDPYLRPLYDALYDIYGAEKAEKLRERGVIEIAPLAYMRGRTLNRARVIIDESQNASISTLKMALTRLGEGSKMVLTGDVTQIDLPHKADSGLEKCAAIIGSVEGVSVIRLNNRDVVRNKIVKDIVKAFEKAEAGKKENGNQSFRDVKRKR